MYIQLAIRLRTQMGKSEYVAVNENRCTNEYTDEVSQA